MEGIGSGSSFTAGLAAGFNGASIVMALYNAAVVRILDYGSNKLHLQLLAVQVAEICYIGRIQLFPVWIPRSENMVADELSRRTMDCDDWQLDPYWFRHLDSIWGPHTIDRFADDANCQLPVFNSKVFCSGTSCRSRRVQSFLGGSKQLAMPAYRFDFASAGEG
jgi:hypothetical protein